MSKREWVAQVTAVSMVTSYENGEQNIQGAEVTAVYKFEYNGIDYGGSKKVKHQDAKTTFFIPASDSIPNVGDVIRVAYETVTEGLDTQLPVLALPEDTAALENPADELDEDALADTEAEVVS